MSTLFPLPNTDLTVIQRSEPELGLNVDKERIQDHMPRPVKLDGTDKELEHPTVAVQPVKTEEQVTRDSATLDTSHQNHQVKCKHELSHPTGFAGPREREPWIRHL